MFLGTSRGGSRKYFHIACSSLVHVRRKSVAMASFHVENSQTLVNHDRVVEVAWGHGEVTPFGLVETILR